MMMILFYIFILVLLIHSFIIFFLDEKDTKNQERTPTPLFILTKSHRSIYYKQRSSRRSFTPTALLPMYVRSICISCKKNTFAFMLLILFSCNLSAQNDTINKSSEQVDGPHQTEVVRPWAGARTYHVHRIDYRASTGQAETIDRKRNQRIPLSFWSDP